MASDQFPSLNVLPSSCFLQNLPSYLIPYLLEPKEGMLLTFSRLIEDVILDMCCSPGGKTTLLSQLMNNHGVIVCTIFLSLYSLDRYRSIHQQVINGSLREPQEV